jgi:hypothetical protein
MAGPCQEIIFVRIFARLNAINIATHVMSQHDRNNIASSLTFVLVRNEISSPTEVQRAELKNSLDDFPTPRRRLVCLWNTLSRPGPR